MARIKRGKRGMGQSLRRASKATEHPIEGWHPDVWIPDGVPSRQVARRKAMLEIKKARQRAKAEALAKRRGG